jgi:hypothetical protein
LPICLSDAKVKAHHSSVSTGSGWRSVSREVSQLVGLWLAGSILALGMIVGSAIGGGFLSVRLFARSAQNGRATASTISDVWHFLLGALVGGVAGVGLVIVVIAVLWPAVFSRDDSMSGSARNWGP